MLHPNNYTVGWICAIVTEYIAAQEFLDEEHERPRVLEPHDSNDYTLGRIRGHNVVIAVSPNGEYGIASATNVATNMLRSFPCVSIGLMVGIAGGAPSATHDIRLGDVVISGHGGVLQYDFGKAIQSQEFQLTGVLNHPPIRLRTAVAGIQSQYKRRGHHLQHAIQTILQRNPRLQPDFQKPDVNTDRLFKSEFIHQLGCHQDSCDDDPANMVVRHERANEDDPIIHYGAIASANQLMKDAKVRDRLSRERNVLCFEMEAAGLMNNFPCLVIRGICDYSDSHKNNAWQGYASMAAAAYAKDILSRIPLNDIESTSSVNGLSSPSFDQRSRSVSPAQGTMSEQGPMAPNQGQVKLLYKNGTLSLHSAASQGHIEMVKLFLDTGADIHTFLPDGTTALHSAARSGHFEMVELLLKYGANIGARLSDNTTPLFSAVSSGCVDIVKLFVENGADIAVLRDDGWTVLHEAASRGHTDVAQFLLDLGMNASKPRNDGWTPLHSAANKSHVEVARLLLERGASMYSMRYDGWTPIHSAAKSAESLKLFLQRGANINIPRRDGWTPLHSASSNGHLDSVQLLLENGADLCARRKDGSTPFYAAVSSGRLEVILYFLKKDTDIHTALQDGWTPLHSAVGNRRLEVAKLLLDNGANPNVSRKDGLIPLHTAADKGFVKEAELLIERGTNINTRLKDGYTTPLHMAASRGHFDLVKLLVENGASIDNQLTGQLTPLQAAKKSGNRRIVDFLLKKGAA